jgi:hypothetical protein
MLLPCLKYVITNFKQSLFVFPSRHTIPDVVLRSDYGTAQRQPPKTGRNIHQCTGPRLGTVTPANRFIWICSTSVCQRLCFLYQRNDHLYKLLLLFCKTHPTLRNSSRLTLAQRGYVLKVFSIF